MDIKKIQLTFSLHKELEEAGVTYQDLSLIFEHALDHLQLEGGVPLAEDHKNKIREQIESHGTRALVGFLVSAGALDSKETALKYIETLSPN